MADFYSSVEAVRGRTGVIPDDLGYDTDDELASFLAGFLAEISELMDRKMRRSYLTETSIPRGLDGIAADIAAESIRQMVATRQTPVVRIDEFAVRTIPTRVFTPDIVERLRLYSGSSGSGVGEMAVGLPDVWDDDEESS